MAAETAEGPGMGKTGMPCCRHARTNLNPGSETCGVPAFETNAIFCPSLSLDINFGAR